MNTLDTTTTTSAQLRAQRAAQRQKQIQRAAELKAQRAAERQEQAQQEQKRLALEQRLAEHPFEFVDHMERVERDIRRAIDALCYQFFSELHKQTQTLGVTEESLHPG